MSTAETPGQYKSPNIDGYQSVEYKPLDLLYKCHTCTGMTIVGNVVTFVYCPFCNIAMPSIVLGMVDYQADVQREQSAHSKRLDVIYARDKTEKDSRKRPQISTDDLEELLKKDDSLAEYVARKNTEQESFVNRIRKKEVECFNALAPEEQELEKIKAEQERSWEEYTEQIKAIEKARQEKNDAFEARQHELYTHMDAIKQQFQTDTTNLRTQRDSIQMDIDQGKRTRKQLNAKLERALDCKNDEEEVEYEPSESCRAQVEAEFLHHNEMMEQLRARHNKRMQSNKRKHMVRAQDYGTCDAPRSGPMIHERYIARVHRVYENDIVFEGGWKIGDMIMGVGMRFSFRKGTAVIKSNGGQVWWSQLDRFVGYYDRSRRSCAHKMGGWNISAFNGMRVMFRASVENANRRTATHVQMIDGSKISLELKSSPCAQCDQEHKADEDFDRWSRADSDDGDNDSCPDRW
eukprot:112055_1